MLGDCCWCSTLLTTRLLGWERQWDVWVDKVNRLKVNSSSCAWATRGTQLGWRRKILAEGARNHLIYETLINSVNSQSHDRFQIYTIYIQYFRFFCRCQCYMFEVSMVTDKAAGPAEKCAHVADRREQLQLELSCWNPQYPPNVSFSWFPAEMLRFPLNRDLPNTCWTCVIGCGA